MGDGSQARGRAGRTHSALALDMGSSSLRALLGTYHDGEVTVQEVYRLPHRALSRDGVLTWDLERMMQAVRRGLELATEVLGRVPDSLGVDGWGVDYGLLDRHGQVLRPPRAYRDPRTSRCQAAIRARLPRAQAWAATGVQPQEINTLDQLVADLAQEPGLRERVSQVLLLPDLVGYLLGGSVAAGRAIASTTALAAPGAHDWCTQVCDVVGIPRSWLPPLVEDRTVAGTTGDGTLIVRPGGHDTACAVHSLGLGVEEVALFISCGSWSLVGATVPQPVLAPLAYRSGLTNEVRSDGGVRLLRNLTGLWLLQECQRAWGSADTGLLVEQATAAPSLGVVVDPDDPVFRLPGDMPTALGRWCEEHYGVRPSGRAQTVRLVLESLACAHALCAARLQQVLGARLDPRSPIHLVGGGARNLLLAQMTASACQRPVHVGASEASALGNVLAQLEALEVIEPRARGQVAATSTSNRVIEPGEGAPFARMIARLTEATSARGAAPDTLRDAPRWQGA